MPVIAIGTSVRGDLILLAECARPKEGDPGPCDYEANPVQLKRNHTPVHAVVGIRPRRNRTDGDTEQPHTYDQRRHPAFAQPLCGPEEDQRRHQQAGACCHGEPLPSAPIGPESSCSHAAFYARVGLLMRFASHPNGTSGCYLLALRY